MGKKMSLSPTFLVRIPVFLIPHALYSMLFHLLDSPLERLIPTNAMVDYGRFRFSDQTVASIPRIGKLREQIDYGDDKINRCDVLKSELNVFRKTFLTSYGVAGCDLWDWKSLETQAGLSEMTDDFLETKGKGAIYWPEDESSPFSNKLRYSTHRLEYALHFQPSIRTLSSSLWRSLLIKRLKCRIAAVLKQLFFRLNQQQHQNLKYRGPARSKSIADSTAPPDIGRSSGEPIDLTDSRISSLPPRAGSSARSGQRPLAPAP